MPMAGTERLDEFLALLRAWAPPDSSSPNSVHFPVERLLAMVADSGLTYVNASGVEPKPDSETTQHVTLAELSAQLAARRGAIFHALAEMSSDVAQPERRDRKASFCVVPGEATLFVSSEYRLTFIVQNGSLRLASIMYDPAEGD